MSEKNDKLKDIDPEVLKAIRDDVIAELRSEEERKKAIEEKKREEELKQREDYVERRKASSTPWVEIMGVSEKDGRVKIELEWNDAFVKKLREAGYQGNEDRIMQQYIAETAYSVANDLSDQGVDVGEEMPAQ